MPIDIQGTTESMITWTGTDFPCQEQHTVLMCLTTGDNSGRIPAVAVYRAWDWLVRMAEPISITQTRLRMSTGNEWIVFCLRTTISIDQLREQLLTLSRSYWELTTVLIRCEGDVSRSPSVVEGTANENSRAAGRELVL